MAISSALNTSNDRVKYTIEIIQNSQNKQNATSNVTVNVRFYRTNTGYETYGDGTVYCKIDGKEYSSSVAWTQKITNSGITLFSKTLDIQHDLKTGKKTLTCSAWINIPGVVTSSEQSFSTALTDIPRASTLTVQNGTLGVSQKFSVTQADASFYHVIKYSCGTVTNTEAVAKTQNTAPPWTPPLSLASQSPGLSTVTVTFTIITYNGTTEIGSNTATATYTIPSSVKPTANLSVSDAMNYKNTYGGYIQGKSKFKVTVTGTPIYNSPIKSYSTTINGGTPRTESSFTTEVIKDAGTYNIVSTVTDERGNSGTDTESVTVLEYREPKLSIVAGRGNADWTENVEGKYILVTATYDVVPLNNKNKFSISYKYRKVGDTKWTEQTLTGNYQDWYTYDLTFRTLEEIDSGSSYELEVSITDNFVTIVQTAIIGSSFVFFHFDGPTKDGNGKNKLNMIEGPDYNSAEDGALKWSFDNDILTISNNVDGLNDAHRLSYNVYNVVAGDVLRFNTTILDSYGRVRVYVVYDEVGPDGYLKQDEYVLNYANGKESYLEVAITKTPLQVHVEFTLGDASGGNLSARWSTRYKRPIVTINEKDMKYERFIVGIEPSLGVGKMAELPNGVDFGLKAKFNRGFVMPTLPAKTNLDNVKEPNFYASADVGTSQYTNCPVTSGTFHLEVVSAGSTGQLRQRIVSCNKTIDTTYERYYYSSSWGSWIRKVNAFDQIYPIGSIYMSVNSTNPGTLFGGTWERLKDKFLLGAGDTYSAGSTGGAATVTLTEAQLPKITSELDVNFVSHRSYSLDSGALAYVNGGKSGSLSGSDNISYGHVALDIGGGQAHNNMPPYLTVYMWKRTA